jgi:phage-related protein
VLGGILLAAIWIVINALNILISVLSFLAQVVENIANTFVHAWRDIIAPTWSGVVGFFRGIIDGIGNVLSDVTSMITKPFHDAYDDITGLFKRLPGDIKKGVVGAGSGISNAAQSVLHALHFASGTDFAPGGMALVGEQGPELVSLPTGSKVMDAKKTTQSLSGNGRSVHIENLNVSNEMDLRRVIRDIGWRLQAA